MQNSLVEQLLIGSNNIDRMRSEIDRVVTILIGCVNEGGKKYLFSDTQIYRLSHAQWEVTTTRSLLTTEARKTMVVRHVIEVGIVSEHNTYNSQNGGKAIETKYVQRVHGDLIHLVDGVSDLIPEINKLWKPLIEASKVKL